jgi:hypothetical protein
MVQLHGPSDPGLELFVPALRTYLDAHPRARVELYRDQEYSAIRIQIVDPRFQKMPWSERHDDVTTYLESVAEADPKVYADLYSLVLLAPKEVGKTGSSLKFQDLMPAPTPKAAPAAARAKKRVR